MVTLHYRTTVRAINVENFLYYEAEKRGTFPCRCTVKLKVGSSRQYDDHFPCFHVANTFSGFSDQSSVYTPRN